MKTSYVKEKKENDDSAWKIEKIPKDWEIGVTVSIYKKGGRKYSGNFRRAQVIEKTLNQKGLPYFAFLDLEKSWKQVENF